MRSGHERRRIGRSRSGDPDGFRTILQGARPMAKKEKQPVNPYRNSASPDELGPCDRVAYDIVAVRRDLLPSVDRIMQAELDGDSRLRAITLFRDSLGVDGDPHRDPRVSIANSGKKRSAAS
jgi:hypothetical protein